MKYQSENFNGSYDFRCGYHNGWYMETHIHEYSELLYCKLGTADVFVNGKHIRLPEKHLVWIPPNSIHRYQCENAHVICAVFSHDFIPLYFAETKQARPIPAAVDLSDMADILDNFHTLDKKDRFRISGYLNLICARVIGQSDFEKAGATDGVLYQKVISYIADHFSEDVSLRGLARHFGYNEKYLSHCLHALTGVHFSKLLSLYRVEHAKKLLAHSNGSIADIAMKCGFSAVNTFNRVFKTMTGTTPSEYRKTANFILYSEEKE